MHLLILEEVDWIKSPSGPDDYSPDLQMCDFCYATAYDDFRNGLSAPRQFYRLLPNGVLSGGEIVCGECVPGVED